MRTYKFNGRTFNGFDKDFSTPHILVLCQDEDTHTCWAIDKDDIVYNIDDLLRYFSASESHEKIIGTYSEQGFIGFKCAEEFVSDNSRFK